MLIYGLHALVFSTFMHTFVFDFLIGSFGRGIMLIAVQILYTLIITIAICKIIDLIKSKVIRRKEKLLKLSA